VRIYRFELTTDDIIIIIWRYEMPVRYDLIESMEKDTSESVAGRLRYIKELINIDSWKNIFDIGAADGKEGVYFATIFPDANVYSFEPSPLNQLRVQETHSRVESSVLSRLKLIPAALSDVSGPISFYAVDEEAARRRGNVNYGMGSILQIKNPDILPWEHSAQIKIDAHSYRIDDWCSSNSVQQVDAIWMDVQGAELHVLRGCGDQLDNIQAVMTEAGLDAYYHGHTMLPEIDQFLRDRGFTEIEAARQYHPQGLELNAIYVNQRYLR
jgi:FkbM family methyltransferase